MVVNTYPYILLTSSLLPILKKRKNEHAIIVNIASSAGIYPEPYAAIYACTKVFDKYFSEALRMEQNQKGETLEVLTVCPMII